MKTVYTEEALVGLVRRLAGLEPSSGSLEIERTDGIDIDELIRTRLRIWYADLLDRGDPSLLVAEDISAKCTVFNAPGPAGAAVISVPASCRRLFSMRLDSWTLPATVLPSENLSLQINRQNNPFTSATNDRPVAVLIGSPDGETDRLLLAWPYDAHDRPALINGVCHPAQGTYIFDQKALSTLPDPSTFIE